MNYFKELSHITPLTLTSGASPQTYSAVVGTVQSSTEHQIVGHSGQHLQFNVNVSETPGSPILYQVDVNVQSADGSEVQMYIGDEALQVQTGSTPFGDPSYGVYTNTALSYASVGLTNAEFVSTPSSRIESQLEVALNAASFVAIFGLAFNDGGPNGKGIHEIHFDPSRPNEDGAIAVYSLTGAGGSPTRRWFFFKFATDSIP